MLDYRVENALRKMFDNGEFPEAPRNWSADNFIDYIEARSRISKSDNEEEEEEETEEEKMLPEKEPQWSKDLKDSLDRARKLVEESNKVPHKKEEEEKKGYWSIFTKEELALFNTARECRDTTAEEEIRLVSSGELKERVSRGIREYAAKHGLKTVPNYTQLTPKPSGQDDPEDRIETGTETSKAWNAELTRLTDSNKAEGIPQEKPYEKYPEPEKYPYRETPKTFKDMYEDNIKPEKKPEEYSKYPKPEEENRKFNQLTEEEKVKLVRQLIIDKKKKAK